MQNSKLQQAISEGALLEIHLISGETYKGTGEKGHTANSFEFKTDAGLLTLPFWTIKRYKRL
ncbi:MULTISPECIES: hypothetical protein [Paenibacillus]|uniref:hypothetical protein n=1 Tax=Paenibacillus TaxID=44249 RepID=UPI0004F75B8C|nr:MULTISPECIES: hypothetical protein [Paenibacillus]AIQ54307.1 hypothetical protein R70331_24100 [Paenibacillus sp. FSL R7-0331]